MQVYHVLMERGEATLDVVQEVDHHDTLMIEVEEISVGMAERLIPKWVAAASQVSITIFHIYSFRSTKIFEATEVRSMRGRRLSDKALCRLLVCSVLVDGGSERRSAAFEERLHDVGDVRTFVLTRLQRPDAECRVRGDAVEVQRHLGPGLGFIIAAIIA